MQHFKKMAWMLVLVLFALTGCQKQNEVTPVEQLPTATGVIQQLEKKLEGKLAWEISFENGFDATNTGLIAKWDTFIRENGAHISNYNLDVYDEKGDFAFWTTQTKKDGEHHSFSELLRFETPNQHRSQIAKQIQDSAQVLSENEMIIKAKLDALRENQSTGNFVPKLRDFVSSVQLVK